MVVEKNWPALPSCKHQCYESNDLLSRLPDDILFIIMSFLTIREVARTSVLSHRWNYLWRYFPVLIFDDFTMMKRMFEDDEPTNQERSRFLRLVNRILEGHLGRYVDELRVTFDLNKRCQSDMNKWLAFALAKQVKRLELDFSSPSRGAVMNSRPRWHLPLDQPPNNLTVFKSCLRSLSLRYVNLTTQDINCLFRSCTVLENLRIEYSRSLKFVRTFDSPLQLKHFEVLYCRHLRTIDILAPKLLSFAHHGDPIKLHIRNASLLSRLSVGYIFSAEDIVAYAFDSLSKYFSQLEYLSWSMQMRVANQQLNLGINNPPSMMNLKHLELQFTASCTQSLFGWAKLIEASPLLERLTLKFPMLFDPRIGHRRIMKRIGRPLNSLKTLELDFYLGYPIDLEFATYVVENSIMLKDVIVVLRPYEPEPFLKDYRVEDVAAQYRKIVPYSVKLTIMKVNHWNDSILKSWKFTSLDS